VKVNWCLSEQFACGGARAAALLLGLGRTASIGWDGQFGWWLIKLWLLFCLQSPFLSVILLTKFQLIHFSISESKAVVAFISLVGKAPKTAQKLQNFRRTPQQEHASRRKIEHYLKARHAFLVPHM
jgi:hypothetical protein